MDRACKDCEFHSTDGTNLMCRRYGPTGSTVREDRALPGMPWIAIWPIVNATDWCGDFKETEKTF